MPEPTESQPNGLDLPPSDSSSSSSKSKRAQRRAAKKNVQKMLKTKEQAFITAHNNNTQTQSQTSQDIIQDGVDEQQEKEKKPMVKQEPEIEVEQLDTSNPLYAEMQAVFAQFAVNASKDANIAAHEDEETSTTTDNKGTTNQNNEEKQQQKQQQPKGLSKKKLKQMARLSIADLKQLVAKPEVVEVHDVNSADPKLLVSLKSYRNTVPVPIHWCQKRKYLQNKRGYEKPPFELPLFIADTGIAKIRGAQAEKEAAASAKSKGRQRMQPKMGKIDIDYQILHDAFFRYQTKPKMTGHGDMYYEGREFEQKLVDKRPGYYSPALRAALNMKDETSPPPWLFAMQRYGPPPSYPLLQIPGVNAPIPVGARWGSNIDEWGNPPLNEFGQPLWGGDLFGTVQQEDGPKIDKTLWGQIEEESEGEEEEEEEAEEAVEEEADEEGMRSVSSFVSGLETPETIQLRKAADGTGTETPNTVNAPRQLYTILEEKKSNVGGAALFGSQHTYVLPTGATPSAEEQLAAKNDARRAKARGQVNVSLNPEDLENLDAATLKRKYDATVEAEAAANKQTIGDEELDVQKRKKPKTDKAKDKAKKDELKGFKF